MKFSSSDIRSGVAAAICFLIYGILVGTSTLSSLLFVASMERFNTDREKASFPFLLCFTTRNVFGPVIGYLGSKFGFKRIILLGSLISSVAVGTCFFAEDILTVTILWGVVFGFGFGMCNAFLPQLLSMHFSKHLDKAVGIYVGGACICSFLLTLLTDQLLKSYGLSGTFLVLSCVVLHSLPVAMLISTPKKVENFDELTQEAKLDTHGNVSCCTQQLELEKSQCKNGRTELTLSSAVSCKESLDRKSTNSTFKVFLDPTYILILILQSAYLYTATVFGVILFDVSRDHGLSETEALYILVGFQVADAIGRFTLGIVTDHGCVSKANFSAVCSFCVGILLISFIWIEGFAVMMVFVLAVGISKGGLTMMSSNIVMHYMDKDLHSMALASRFLLYGPISFTQAPLIGYFRGTLCSYDGLIWVLVGISCVSGVGFLLIPSFVRFRERRKEYLQFQQGGTEIMS